MAGRNGRVLVPVGEVQQPLEPSGRRRPACSAGVHPFFLSHPDPEQRSHSVEELRELINRELTEPAKPPCTSCGRPRRAGTSRPLSSLLGQSAHLVAAVLRDYPRSGGTSPAWPKTGPWTCGSAGRFVRPRRINTATVSAVTGGRRQRGHRSPNSASGTATASADRRLCRRRSPHRVSSDVTEGRYRGARQASSRCSTAAPSDSNSASWWSPAIRSRPTGNSPTNPAGTDSEG